jgi:AAA domain
MTIEFLPPDPRLDGKVKILRLKDRQLSQPGRALITSRASEVAPQRIDWIWPGRIARGKHTTIAGDPGAGKSQVMISIIAAVTTGGELPCREGNAPLGSVIILAAEDGVCRHDRAALAGGRRRSKACPHRDCRSRR